MVEVLLPEPPYFSIKVNKLSIIIVNYNVCYFLEQVLKSIYNSKINFKLEVWVVDNNSIDHSVQMVEEKFPNVNLIVNKKNVGFSKANNQGVKCSNAEYVLLLNPDTVLEEDTLQKCLDYMESNPKAGALGVKMLDGRGVFLPESKRSLPTPWVAFYKIFGLSKLFPKSKKFGSYHLKYLDENEIHEVEVLAGAFMFIRKELYERVNGLDEDYFMYGEDIDLSYKIIKEGYKNIYFPKTNIIHYKGESTKKTSVRYVYVFYKAMIIFAQKHFTKRKAAVLSVLIYLAIFAKASLEVIKNIFRTSALSMADGVLITGSLALFSKVWENSYKLDLTNKFPLEYYLYVIPAYATIWILSNFLSGGNDRPYNVFKLLRGVILGTLIISAGSNFFDHFRYSKATILIGGTISFLVFLFNRLFTHYLEYKNLELDKETSKNVALVGDSSEVTRVHSIIKKVSQKLNVLGFISVHRKHSEIDLPYLGSIEQMQETLELNPIDELIFCSKDISYGDIIEIMTKRGEVVDFKIVPQESDYIIGSNSKDHPGDYYALEVKFNLNEKDYRRNKRLLDILLSVVLLALCPILVFINKRPLHYLKNSLSVFIGLKTWVGFTTADIKLPKLKKGVLTTTCGLKRFIEDRTFIQSKDFSYAKNYSYWDDIKIVYKSLSNLGR